MKLAAVKSNQKKGAKEERRLGLERRQFFYSVHVPERRSGHRRSKELGPGAPYVARDDQNIEE
jgi:hypothetical protein